MGREKPNFLRVTLLLALFNLVLSAAIIVGIPIMVVQLLHGSDTQLGLTQGALGLGGLMGGLLASGLGARLRLHHSPAACCCWPPEGWSSWELPFCPWFLLSWDMG